MLEFTEIAPGVRVATLPEAAANVVVSDVGEAVVIDVGGSPGAVPSTHAVFAQTRALLTATA